MEEFLSSGIQRHKRRMGPHLLQQAWTFLASIGKPPQTKVYHRHPISSPPSSTSCTSNLRVFNYTLQIPIGSLQLPACLPNKEVHENQEVVILDEQPRAWPISIYPADDDPNFPWQSTLVLLEYLYDSSMHEPVTIEFSLLVQNKQIFDDVLSHRRNLFRVRCRIDNAICSHSIDSGS